MARKVKIPESKTAFGLDEIEDFDLAVDDYSQGGESQWSVDVSDYEDNIKDAPRRVYIGPDRCRKVFQLANDTEQGVVRVCGGPDDCRRAGHKALEKLGAVGTYETIKTTKYIDGLIHTHRSREAEDRLLAEERDLRADAMT